MAAIVILYFPPTAPPTLTLKALTNELKAVSDWHSLGVNLDLKRHQLSEIEKNHRGDDKRCRTEVLGCWLDNTTTPTWEAIAEALDLMEAHTAADNIRRKYITTHTEGIISVLCSKQRDQILAQLICIDISHTCNKIFCRIYEQYLPQS